MKDDLRRATDIVISLKERGQKEAYIERCDLSADDLDILRRVWVKRQSRVEIALDKRMDTRTVDRHYRKAMLVLAAIVEKYK